jgi:hypothetical protein
MFLTSPRNSIAAHINLLEQLDCKKILMPEPKPPPVLALLAVHQLEVVPVPTVDDLLQPSHAHFPFESDFSETLSLPFFVV